MTRGFLLIAHDTEETPYGKLSCLAAKLLKKHFDLPVSVITDKFTKLDNDLFDEIIFNEIGSDNYRFDVSLSKKVKWRNTDRSDAYLLSPYDQTILIDSDYLIQNNNLELLFNQSIDFLCHNSMLDITGTGQFQNDSELGSAKIPFCWATVIYFKKSEYAESIFTMWKHIKNNYEYYMELYNLNKSIYRNDYALSIAMHMINGQVINKKFIPWPLMNVPLQSTVNGVSAGALVYSYNSYNPNNGQTKLSVQMLPNLNLHFFNKLNYENIANELTA
jgi:hypothetical protein